MEVVAFGPVFACIGAKRTELLATQVHDVALDLERAADEEERRRRDEEGLAFEPFGCDDHVDDSGFVFDREEDEALGGTGALAADDESGEGDSFVVASAAKEVARGADAVRRQKFPQVSHGVAGEGEPGQAVVGVREFEGRHGR